MILRHACVVAAAVLLCQSTSLTAASTGPKDDPGKLQSLRVDTGRSREGGFSLAGRDASQQLIITGQYTSGVRDLTHTVQYEANPVGIVDIDSTGYVLAKKEGKATIRIRGPQGLQARTTVTVSHIENDLPINFPNQVVPIFTKFGCNAGGCHGKADGQNGFKLSLLGFYPQEDHEFIRKEARGRRLFPAAPAHSLLLLKATGQVAHGGGKKLNVGSPSYRLLLRWIQQGAPYGEKEDPTVTRIEVLPKERILPSTGKQQLAVIAHFSDGSTADVTRMTQFESNEPELGRVSEEGIVQSLGKPGMVAVMARFQTHVAVFRGAIPLGASVTNVPPMRNFIDTLVARQWKKLGLPPSDLCDDATFLRRVTLDLCGRLPTLEETRQFLASKEANKHEKLVDRLLASKDYADYFANKWSAVLRNRRKDEKVDPKATFAFHAWIRDSLHTNKPYDRFVREILTASGEEVKTPPTVWYREVNEPSAQVEDVAQLFLGQRIGCARCHHHPFEKWSQKDYHSMTAFFSRLEIKDPPPPKRKRRKKKGKQPPPKKPPLTVMHRPGTARSIHPRTNEQLLPTALGSTPLNLSRDEDPRHKLVDWMTAKDNPYFARTLVNRYWKHFFGRGLVDPEDDMRVTNPPTNPELLDALATHFAKNNYDLKNLVRTICTSSVYRLSAMPNDHNATDTQNFSRFLPRRVNAEVLLDSIDDLTLSKTRFRGVPADTRAIQLPDNQFASYFLSVFGRPESATACECERSGDVTLAQSLHLLNSPEILKKLSGKRASNLARDKRPEKEKVEELYLLAFSRLPTDEELKVVQQYLEKKKGSTGYQDILWVLINTKEFQFNH